MKNAFITNVSLFLTHLKADLIIYIIKYKIKYLKTIKCKISVEREVLVNLVAKKIN